MSATQSARGWLHGAQQNLEFGEVPQSVASSLIGLLSFTIDAAEADEQESIAQQKWDECDAALGRVLALADTLDAYPNATLKPMAFGELAARIRAAVDGTEPDGESA